MSTPAPFTCSAMEVEKDWIDYNGHMNMAYYNVLFDRCADQAYEKLGLGPDYASSRHLTTYTAEFHICYVRELHLGHKVHGTFQLLDHDEKRFHTFQELWHEDGWLAATGEALTLHIDMTGPRVAPFPEDIHAAVSEMMRAHTDLPRPERAGRSIGIRRK
ncbi:thioesterase family protein [Sediminimonas qiaohouensis]|uniref:thioesterase family protein n=1 Tax=Sediminimonas qiaohouensis TaxID=552061 RepID=UPI000409D819|nr:thioesterase family protein [Sediminimonas qiaohouensis]